MKLAYFHADGCGVCHEKTPVVREVARAAGLPLEVLDYDDPAVRRQAEALRVTTVPTLALVDGERVRFRLVGVAITPENVRHLLRNLGPPAPPPAG
jgi:thiol-disulfide isomerase/thioredoxin